VAGILQVASEALTLALFAREGETKSQYVTAIESSSAATPSSNCQPVPTRTFFGNSGISHAGGAFLRPEDDDATR